MKLLVAFFVLLVWLSGCAMSRHSMAEPQLNESVRLMEYARSQGLSEEILKEPSQLLIEAKTLMQENKEALFSDSDRQAKAWQKAELAELKLQKILNENRLVVEKKRQEELQKSLNQDQGTLDAYQQMLNELKANRGI